MPVYIGTSGFFYPEWIGPVYPDGTPQSKMLETYAGMFDVVEINATFYRPPSKTQFNKYPERTGGQMKIVVKLHSSFTHQRDALNEDASKISEAMKPIEDSGQFSGYLAQFPQSFHNTRDARAHIEKLREMFPDAPLICEFRHKSWWNRDVLEFLRDFNIAMSCVDAPDISNLPPSGATYTADPAYVRLHGRNAESWYAGDREGRYTYKYSQDELHEWLQKVKKLMVKSGEIYVAFNNHPFGYAAMDAQAFLEILRDAIPDSLPVRVPATSHDPDQPTLF